ncbi:starch-binding protein [Flavobacterium sp. 5]|uniref:starch-binding protein n=1 Tax=Flavobacterium sp. 5 TaxID=2035199 RepID=UPI000C2CCC80|nr:starch-binding protein [Flavobacterium sp. 5]PKB18915.1 putative secreted protein (Por secretion system target) [Flavobacterium sp. 5]
MKLKNYFLLFVFFLLHSFVFSQTKATGKEVMIQGFHWTTDVSATKWYEVIKSNSSALQTAGFDAIWLPPPSKSTGGMGYIPTVWYDLNNAQGTQAQLVSLITDLHSKNIKVIADIVINHRGGTLGWYDFSTPSWNTPTETWSICNTSNISASGQKGTGAPDYDPVAAGLKSAGESGSFAAARDLDHSNALVREGIKTWMNWLKNDIGFDGWRYDFVHGYDGKYIKEYNDATNPYFSVGELLEGDRSKIVKWLDYTKGGTTTAASTAFDFATKSALQNAFKDNNLSYLKDGSGKASGLIGVWPSNAVTMLDNHDTGPSPYGQDLWVFPGDQVLKGYAYLLTHPGTPMVWWPHYFNWGIKNEIDAMIKIRKDNGLSSTSTLNIVAATNNLYAAIIDDKVAMKLGSDSWSPSGTGWTLKLSGTGFAIWDKGVVVDVPSLTIAPAGGTFGIGTTVSAVLTANNPSSIIYYTLDGTAPNSTSPSAVGTKILSISSNTTLKALVKNTANVSSTIYSEIYNFAAIPTFTVYFKKPSTWASTMKVYYWGTTGTAPVLTWPGVAMTQDCGDWYAYTFPSTVSASNLVFTDGTLKTVDLTATAGIKYYDTTWLSAEPTNRCPVVTPDFTFSQIGGTFTAGTTVSTTLTANVNTSTIYYTLDGTTPTTASASAVGTKVISITANTTVKAFVKNTAGTSSAIKTEVYNLVTPTTFTVYFKKPTTWASTMKVYYWGTTGTAPTLTWPGVAMTQDCGDWYSYTFPSTVSTSNLVFTDGTLKTVDLTASAGIKYYDSAWLSAEPTNRCPVVAPDLTILQAGGTFTTGTTVSVALTANVNTSTIYYTLDGTTPTTASTSAVGAKALSITANTTVKAFVKNTAGTSSVVKTEVYNFVTPTTFTVYFKKPSTWASTVKVYYWGTTGTAPVVTWPGVAMTQDCGDWYAFTFPSTVSASNIIFNDGTLKTVDLTATAGIKYYDSAWLAAEPTNRCPVVAPDLTILSAGGTFTTGATVSVVLTANVNTSTIYYTLDGTTPTTASTSAVGTKTLSITANTTVKTLVKNTAGTLSSIKTEVYTFVTVPTLTVYFKPPTTWTGTPKVHYWNAVPTGSVASTTWPGVAMVADTNGFYKYTITGPTSVNLIFNNGSTGTANQTADLLNKTNGYSYSWGASTAKLGVKEEVTTGTSVALYPNPVSSLLQISSDLTVLDYQILSINGVAVQSGKVNNNTIDVDSLPSGIYFVKIHFENGQECLKKIIKK